MKISPTSIEDLEVIETSPFSDHRGTFARFFCARELGDILQHRRIVQVNHSRTSRAGAVRGLHYQRPPHAEMKLVRCIRGCIWDVAVDLRAGSPTFLRWHGEKLTPGNAKMLSIPEGFAHGFQALEADSELLYLTTAFYEPSAEGGLRHDDPQLRIEWPLAVTDMSDRDHAHSLLGNDFVGIRL